MFHFLIPKTLVVKLISFVAKLKILKLILLPTKRQLIYKTDKINTNSNSAKVNIIYLTFPLSKKNL